MQMYTRLRAEPGAKGPRRGPQKPTCTARCSILNTMCRSTQQAARRQRGGRYVPITILAHPSLGEAFRRAKGLALAFGSGYVMKTLTGSMSLTAFCVLNRRALACRR
jgi:hypothetical protein